MSKMAHRNIMVIDGAINCAYDIFALPDHDFDVLFPEKEQDIQFVEDLDWSDQIKTIVGRLWENPVAKANVIGIHGTLYFGFEAKKEYFPNKRDSDLDFKGRAFSVRSLLGG